MILSGAILIAGVLYWLWSHIQLTQKKVQLLENAVFELRSMLAARGTEPPAPVAAGSSGGITQAPAPAPAPVQKAPSIYNDLEDDDWREPEKTPLSESEQISTPIDAPELVTSEVDAQAQAPVSIIKEDDNGAQQQPESDDLAPGAPRTVTVGEVVPGEERFRELFATMEPPAAAAAGATAAGPRTPESLESMPVKELRRLAVQRGIADADSMRKKEILAALRQQITSAPAPAPAPAGDVLVVKDVEVELDAAPAAEAVAEDAAAVDTDIAEILE